MMKILKRIFVYLILVVVVTSCSTESPFSSDEYVDGEGRFLTSSLSVEVTTKESVVRSETSSTVDVENFSVDFVNVATEDTVKHYKKSDLPEVVTLGVADYKVVASYGPNYSRKGSGYDCPYYLGESSQFSIEKDKIIDHIEPIVCRLANIGVTIEFSDELKNHIDENAVITVKVGDCDSLTFKKDNTHDGYFEYKEGSSTLVASFEGKVDGEDTYETKLYDNITVGKHYKIAFKLHKVDPNEPGNINPGEEGDEIKIDASVTTEGNLGQGGEDINHNEEYLIDDRYPNTNPDQPDPIDPGKDDPDPDDPDLENGPKFTVAEGSGLILGAVNVLTDDLEIKFSVTSKTGITGFSVDIISDSLTKEELESVGLSDHLDLVDPGELSEPLSNFGFPINVAGQTFLEFDITPFKTLLSILEGDHTFKITATDANGTTVKDLTLRIEL